MQNFRIMGVTDEEQARYDFFDNYERLMFEVDRFQAPDLHTAQCMAEYLQRAQLYPRNMILDELKPNGKRLFFLSF